MLHFLNKSLNNLALTAITLLISLPNTILLISLGPVFCLKILKEARANRLGGRGGGKIVGCYGSHISLIKPPLEISLAPSVNTCEKKLKTCLMAEGFDDISQFLFFCFLVCIFINFSLGFELSAE